MQRKRKWHVMFDNAPMLFAVLSFKYIRNFLASDFSNESYINRSGFCLWKGMSHLKNGENYHCLLLKQLLKMFLFIWSVSEKFWKLFNEGLIFKWRRHFLGLWHQQKKNATAMCTHFSNKIASTIIGILYDPNF